MEEDDELYSGILDYSHEEITKLTTLTRSLIDENSSLRRSLDDAKAQIEQANKAKAILKRNFESLLKTARAEIDRKDSRIAELQKTLDTQAARELGVSQFRLDEIVRRRVKEKTKRRPRLKKTTSFSSSTPAPIGKSADSSAQDNVSFKFANSSFSIVTEGGVPSRTDRPSRRSPEEPPTSQERKRRRLKRSSSHILNTPSSQGGVSQAKLSIADSDITSTSFTSVKSNTCSEPLRTSIYNEPLLDVSVSSGLSNAASSNRVPSVSQISSAPSGASILLCASISPADTLTATTAVVIGSSPSTSATSDPAPIVTLSTVSPVATAISTSASNSSCPVLYSSSVSASTVTLTTARASDPKCCTPTVVDPVFPVVSLSATSSTPASISTSAPLVSKASSSTHASTSTSSAPASKATFSNHTSTISPPPASKDTSRTQVSKSPASTPLSKAISLTHTFTTSSSAAFKTPFSTDVSTTTASSLAAKAISSTPHSDASAIFSTGLTGVVSTTSANSGDEPSTCMPHQITGDKVFDALSSLFTNDCTNQNDVSKSHHTPLNDIGFAKQDECNPKHLSVGALNGRDGEESTDFPASGTNGSRVAVSSVAPKRCVSPYSMVEAELCALQDQSSADEGSPFRPNPHGDGSKLTDGVPRNYYGSLNTESHHSDSRQSDPIVVASSTPPKPIVKTKRSSSFKKRSLSLLTFTSSDADGIEENLNVSVESLSHSMVDEDAQTEGEVIGRTHNDGSSISGVNVHEEVADPSHQSNRSNKSVNCSDGFDHGAIECTATPITQSVCREKNNSPCFNSTSPETVLTPPTNTIEGNDCDKGNLSLYSSNSQESRGGKNESRIISTSLVGASDVLVKINGGDQGDTLGPPTHHTSCSNKLSPHYLATPIVSCEPPAIDTNSNCSLSLPGIPTSDPTVNLARLSNDISCTASDDACDAFPANSPTHSHTMVLSSTALASSSDKSSVNLDNDLMLSSDTSSIMLNTTSASSFSKVLQATKSISDIDSHENIVPVTSLSPEPTCASQKVESNLHTKGVELGVAQPDDASMSGSDFELDAGLGDDDCLDLDMDNTALKNAGVSPSRLVLAVNDINKNSSVKLKKSGRNSPYQISSPKRSCSRSEKDSSRCYGRRCDDENRLSRTSVGGVRSSRRSPSSLKSSRNSRSSCSREKSKKSFDIEHGEYERKRCGNTRSETNSNRSRQMRSPPILNKSAEKNDSINRGIIVDSDIQRIPKPSSITEVEGAKERLFGAGDHSGRVPIDELEEGEIVDADSSTESSKRPADDLRVNSAGRLVRRIAPICLSRTIERRSPEPGQYSQSIHYRSPVKITSDRIKRKYENQKYKSSCKSYRATPRKDCSRRPRSPHEVRCRNSRTDLSSRTPDRFIRRRSDRGQRSSDKADPKKLQASKDCQDVPTNSETRCKNAAIDSILPQTPQRYSSGVKRNLRSPKVMSPATKRKRLVMQEREDSVKERRHRRESVQGVDVIGSPDLFHAPTRSRRLSPATISSPDVESASGAMLQRYITSFMTNTPYHEDTTQGVPSIEAVSGASSPAPLVDRLAVSPSPFVDRLAVSPSPFVDRLAVSPSPFVDRLAVSPSPFVDRLAVSPSPTLVASEPEKTAATQNKDTSEEWTPLVVVDVPVGCSLLWSQVLKSMGCNVTSTKPLSETPIVVYVDGASSTIATDEQNGKSSNGCAIDTNVTDRGNHTSESSSLIHQVAQHQPASNSAPEQRTAICQLMSSLKSTRESSQPIYDADSSNLIVSSSGTSPKMINNCSSSVTNTSASSSIYSSTKNSIEPVPDPSHVVFSARSSENKVSFVSTSNSSERSSENNVSKLSPDHLSARSSVNQVSYSTTAEPPARNSLRTVRVRRRRSAEKTNQLSSTSLTGISVSSRI